MFRLKIAAAAVILSVSMLGSAQAAPVSPAATTTAATDLSVIQVQDRERNFRRDRNYRRGDRNFRRDRGYRRGDRDFRRYNRPPRGWRRYRSRPRDYRTRGCILFGPLWFCP